MKTVEIIYTWPDGSREVRYRRPEGTHDAKRLISEVDSLILKEGKRCPYSYELVDDKNLFRRL